MAGATNTYHWGTLYATQFLLEAQKAGFHVPESDLSRAIAWIKSKLGNENKEDASDIRAYSVQVLAQAGNLPTGWLKRLLETQEELSPESRIRLAMAHIYTGDRRKAGAIAKKYTPPRGIINVSRTGTRWDPHFAPVPYSLTCTLNWTLDQHRLRNLQPTYRML